MTGSKKVFLSFAVIMLCGVVQAQAATPGPSLAVGTVSGKAGSSVRLPVTLSPAAHSISGLQFNLTLPAGLSLVSTKADSSLKAAGKKMLTHQKDNVWTFIIYGPKNNKVLENGTLLTALVQIAPGTAKGSLSVPISGEVYSSPEAQMVASGTSTAGAVQVSATEAR